MIAELSPQLFILIELIFQPIHITTDYILCVEINAVGQILCFLKIKKLQINTLTMMT